MRQTKAVVSGSHQTMDQLKGVMKSQPQAISVSPQWVEMKSKVKMLKLLHIVIEKSKGHDLLLHFRKQYFLNLSFYNSLLMDHAPRYLIHLKYSDDAFTGDILSF